MERPPITDSPWFWVLMFSLVSFGALVAIGGKYGHRQAEIEREYQARERIAAGNVADGLGAAPRPYATPDTTLIPLWPLAVVLGLVAAAAGAMLVRERWGRGRGRPSSRGDGKSDSP